MKWGPKQSYILRQELSKYMWLVTYTQVTESNSRLLMVESQIDTLIPGPFFNHNLCFKYPNEICEPILNIYFLRAFQWYNELFNPMSFDPCNCSIKIRESQWTLAPKVGAHLGVCGSFPHTFIHSWKHEIWLLGFTFSSYLCKPLFWSWTQGQNRNI